MGIGNTLQAARHDAASRALEVLKPLTPENETCDTTTVVDDPNSDDLKSPISLVHEMALKRNLTVAFQVQSEKGPPHMKSFITLCIVGTVTVSKLIVFFISTFILYLIIFCSYIDGR